MLTKLANSIRNTPKKNILLLTLLFVSFVSITVTGIIFKQTFFMIFPLYVSLFVGLLQSRANRFAYLVGGLNCINYGIINIFVFKLYASAASNLLFSLPLQLFTFWSWNKRSYKQSVKFRSLRPRHWCILLSVITVGFVGVHFLLNLAGSNHSLLDNILTVVGLAVSILSLLSFREYSWFMLITGSLNLVLYIILATEDIAQITYTIYAIHSMISIVLQFFSVRKIYAEQRKIST